MVQGTQGEAVTPMTVAVTPGRHTVMLGLDGYEPTTISVHRVAEHTTRAINVSLGALTRKALPSATPTPRPPRAAASVPYPTYTETPPVRVAAPPRPYQAYPVSTPTPKPAPTASFPMSYPTASIPLDAKINNGDPTKNEH